MLQKSVTISQAIILLNSALVCDPKAIQELIEARVECNETLAKHPTIQVGRRKAPDGTEHRVGLLGIINGLFGIRDSDGYGAIHAECQSDGTIVAFAPTTDDRHPSYNPNPAELP